MKSKMVNIMKVIVLAGIVKLNRVGSPTVVWSNGSAEWFLEGMFHREDDSPKSGQWLAQKDCL